MAQPYTTQKIVLDDEGAELARRVKEIYEGGEWSRQAWIAALLLFVIGIWIGFSPLNSASNGYLLLALSFFFSAALVSAVFLQKRWQRAKKELRQIIDDNPGFLEALEVVEPQLGAQILHTLSSTPMNVPRAG